MRAFCAAPLALFAALAVLAFASPAPAAEPAGGYVRDDAGVLTTRTIRDVDDLNAQWGSEGKTTRLKVVTLPDLDKPIDEAARDLFVSSELDGDDILVVYSTGFWRTEETLLVGDDLKPVIPDDLTGRMLASPDCDDCTVDSAVESTVSSIRGAIEAGGARRYFDQLDRRFNAVFAVVLYVPLLGFTWFGMAFIREVRRTAMDEWASGRLHEDPAPFTALKRLSGRRRRLAAAGYADAEIDWIENTCADLLFWTIVLTAATAIGLAVIVPLALRGGFPPLAAVTCAAPVAAPALFWNVRVHLLRFPRRAGGRPATHE